MKKLGILSVIMLLFIGCVDAEVKEAIQENRNVNVEALPNEEVHSVQGYKGTAIVVFKDTLTNRYRVASDSSRDINVIVTYSDLK